MRVSGGSEIGAQKAYLNELGHELSVWPASGVSLNGIGGAHVLVKLCP